MRLLITGLLFFSCATSKIILKTEELLPYKEANQLTKLGSLSKSISLTNVEVRNPSQSLGFGHTGVTYDKTPILFDSEPNAVLKQFLVRALEMRNILLASDSKTKMEIYFDKVEVNEVIEKFQGEKAKCSVEAKVYVETEGKKWSGKFMTEFLSASDLREGTERLAPTLASCLNEIVEKLVNDSKFTELIKR